MLKSVAGVDRDGKVALTKKPGDMRDEESQGIEHQRWAELGMNRLEQEWDNPEDAVYDDWKKLYDV